MTELVFDGTFANWKAVARGALARRIRPADAQWIDAQSRQQTLALAEEETSRTADAPSAYRVPKEFLSLAAAVSCHRDPTRWDLLYRALWRITHGEPQLLEISVDPDTHALAGLAKAVRRDIHKMHAFVRFREITGDAGPWYVAWFEPQHYIVEATASFFRDRFAAMRWSILTPNQCAHWDGVRLHFTPGVCRESAPAEDAMEDLWRTYYGSIFNPARLKIGAMTAEMPRHYWKNLPEAQLIPSLLAAAEPRVSQMIESSAAARVGMDDVQPLHVPSTTDLAVLRDAAMSCRGCPLWKNATCTVFGDGSVDARVVIVGEQPGDQEDRTGRPFVGPAGQLFDRALAAAGIGRARLYVTNAVKHFKWEPRGKRRLHQKPNAREVAACRPWLDAELRAIQPDLIVCLGATAAHSVLRRPVAVLSERGQIVATEYRAPALITVHPSSLLRMPVQEDADKAFEQFVADLRLIGNR